MSRLNRSLGSGAVTAMLCFLMGGAFTFLSYRLGETAASDSDDVGNTDTDRVGFGAFSAVAGIIALIAFCCVACRCKEAMRPRRRHSRLLPLNESSSYGGVDDAKGNSDDGVNDAKRNSRSASSTLETSCCFIAATTHSINPGPSGDCGNSAPCP